MHLKALSVTTAVAALLALPFAASAQATIDAQKQPDRDIPRLPDTRAGADGKDLSTPGSDIGEGPTGRTRVVGDPLRCEKLTGTVKHECLLREGHATTGSRGPTGTGMGSSAGGSGPGPATSPSSGSTR